MRWHRAGAKRGQKMTKAKRLNDRKLRRARGPGMSATYLFVYVATHRAGSFGYSAERQRGTIDVWHDSKRYIYRKPDRDVPVRMVKADILAAFESDSRCTMRISGKFPSYTIEST